MKVINIMAVMLDMQMLKKLSHTYGKKLLCFLCGGGGPGNLVYHVLLRRGKLAV